jgi:hypothetical protein
MKYMREDLKFMNAAKSAGGAAYSPAKGLYEFSRGGGLSSIFSGIGSGLEKAVQSGAFLAPFLTGMTLARGARGAAKGVATAEAAEGIEGAEAVAAGGALGQIFKNPAANG